MSYTTYWKIVAWLLTALFVFLLVAGEGLGAITLAMLGGFALSLAVLYVLTRGE